MTVNRHKNLVLGDATLSAGAVLDTQIKSEAIQLFGGTEGTADGNMKFHDSQMAVDSSGNLYVTGYAIGKMQKFNSSGVYQSKISLAGCTGIVLDETNDRLYLACLTDGKVRSYKISDLSAVATSAVLSNVTMLALFNGMVFACAYGSANISSIDLALSDGSWTTRYASLAGNVYSIVANATHLYFSRLNDNYLVKRIDTDYALDATDYCAVYADTSGLCDKQDYGYNDSINPDVGIAIDSTYVYLRKNKSGITARYLISDGSYYDQISYAGAGAGFAAGTTLFNYSLWAFIADSTYVYYSSGNRAIYRTRKSLVQQALWTLVSLGASDVYGLQIRTNYRGTMIATIRKTGGGDVAVTPNTVAGASLLALTAGETMEVQLNFGTFGYPDPGQFIVYEVNILYEESAKTTPENSPWVA
jgi:hypothetical protein